MHIYDISMKINATMPVYKAKPLKRPIFTLDSDFVSGETYETRLEMNMHTGTHIDMPLHFIEGGNSIDQIDLGQVVTPCKVFDFSSAEGCISRSHLETKPISKNDFILLKTRNSTQDILEGNFIYLDGSGASYLKSLGIKGVGIDALGIERSQPDHETHKELLSSGIIIIEGLRLKEIDEGEYFLFAAPVNVEGAEAAPTRALLLDKNIISL